MPNLIKFVKKFSDRKKFSAVMQMCDIFFNLDIKLHNMNFDIGNYKIRMEVVFKLKRILQIYLM